MENFTSWLRQTQRTDAEIVALRTYLADKEIKATQNEAIYEEIRGLLSGQPDSGQIGNIG